MMASAETERSPEVVAHHSSDFLRLTTQDAPRVTRHFLVRVSGAQPPSKKSVEVEMTARISASWTPKNPEHAARPWLHARLSMGEEERDGDELLILERNPVSQQVLEVRAASFSRCMLNEVCEWEVPLELELQTQVVEGSVTLSWNVEVAARVVDASKVPEGFTVELLSL
ncbi:hypothetical protein [Hyalangium gracile]|uniref:hypothetical protein n=1 Tax=Hyalangium gracile TaxID=394092 RepID=UPI001CCAAA4E|nr:hypothetical protein [Hyalangium gracile]